MTRVCARLLVAMATATVVAGILYVLVIGNWTDVAVFAASGVAVGVAWVVVRRDPTSWVGPAVAWSTACIVLVAAHVGALAGLPWSSGIWPLNLAGLLVLMLVFPDRPLTGWPWRATPWVFAAATVAMIAAQWGARQVRGRVVGGPRGPWVTWCEGGGSLAVAVSLILGVASLAVRYRRGDWRTRGQIKWLALAGAVVVILLVAGWVAESAGVPLDAAYGPFLGAIILLIPAAVAVAIVQYDLFDVDRILSGAASWLVTIVVSAAIFALVVYGASHALMVETGMSDAGAAFVTALALLPLQRVVASRVGQVVDRDRHLAVSTVERFAAEVRAGTRQPEEIEAVLREVQRDPTLTVQIVGPDGCWTLIDGTPVAEPTGLMLGAGGDVVACIHLGWDSARARRRIADVARTAWVPIEVSRLQLRLRQALGEAEASRRRIVEETSAERRRLERDLHDGAQQRIVTIGMRLRLLQERLAPEEAAQVDAAVGELRTVIDELRRLANGVRPSQLDDGLAAALHQMSRPTPVPVEVHTDRLPDLPEVMALTAYLVVSEAVANALKHARASRVRVKAQSSNDRLSLEISDDGIGGVPGDAPLPALRDRVVSVGGALQVHSSPGCGTTILVTI